MRRSLLHIKAPLRISTLPADAIAPGPEERNGVIPETLSAETPVSVTARNRSFYEALWSRTYLTRPERFNSWPLIASFLPRAKRRLEVGPGLRPRLPVANTAFVDLSPTVVEKLNAQGGRAHVGEITALPFDEGEFDLVAAFDVIEHAENDERVFSELTRVLSPEGCLIFSVPLHPARWSGFDVLVGHARRYTASALVDLLARHGLRVTRSAVFGMQSNQPWLLDFTVLGLTKHFAVAVRCYNWLFFPLGVLLQRPLRLQPGLINLSDVDEVLLVCVCDSVTTTETLAGTS